jgi:hypothetical protein
MLGRAALWYCRAVSVFSRTPSLFLGDGVASMWGWGWQGVAWGFMLLPVGSVAQWHAYICLPATSVLPAGLPIQSYGTVQYSTDYQSVHVLALVVSSAVPGSIPCLPSFCSQSPALLACLAESDILRQHACGCALLLAQWLWLLSSKTQLVRSTAEGHLCSVPPATRLLCAIALPLVTLLRVLAARLRMPQLEQLQI